MKSKINILGLPFLLISIIGGTILSFFISKAIYNQAKSNLDTKSSIESVIRHLDEQTQSQLIQNPVETVGDNLSEYNKKIVNSILLKKIIAYENIKIFDPYLIDLKENDEYKKHIDKNYAIKRYGKVVALFVGVFSIFLTTPIIWLILSSIVYAFKLL